MEATGVIQDLLGRAREVLAPIVELSDDELYAEPLPSMGWCAWRLGRSLDYNIGGLMRLEQLWIADGWHERFAMSPEPKDFLPGFPPPDENVRTFRAPRAQLLVDYFDAVHARADGYVASLSAEDLDRELDEPQYDPRPTVSVRLVSVGVAMAQSTGLIRYRMWMAGKGR